MEVQREREGNAEGDGGVMKMEISDGLARYPAGLGFLVVSLEGEWEMEDVE